MEHLPVDSTTLEDLKTNENRGVTTSDFYVYVKVPVKFISNPVENQGISILSANTKELQDTLLTCTKAFVKKTYSKNLIICFVVSSKYLSIFHRNLRKLESAFLIKGERYE